MAITRNLLVLALGIALCAVFFEVNGERGGRRYYNDYNDYRVRAGEDDEEPPVDENTWTDDQIVADETDQIIDDQDAAIDDQYVTDQEGDYATGQAGEIDDKRVTRPPRTTTKPWKTSSCPPTCKKWHVEAVTKCPKSEHVKPCHVYHKKDPHNHCRYIVCMPHCLDDEAEISMACADGTYYVDYKGYCESKCFANFTLHCPTTKSPHPCHHHHFDNNPGVTGNED